MWHAINSSKDAVDIVLLTCTAGEEVARIHTNDPEVRAYLRSRISSELPETTTGPGASPPPPKGYRLSTSTEL